MTTIEGIMLAIIVLAFVLIHTALWYFIITLLERAYHFKIDKARKLEDAKEK